MYCFDLILCRHYLVLFVFICSLLDSIVWAAEGANLVTNGDSETGDATGWYSIGTASILDSDAHSGTYSARDSIGCSYKQVLIVVPNTKYVLTDWAKSEDISSVMTLGVRGYGRIQTFLLQFPKHIKS